MSIREGSGGSRQSLTCSRPMACKQPSPLPALNPQPAAENILTNAPAMCLHLSRLGDLHPTSNKASLWRCTYTYEHTMGSNIRYCSPKASAAGGSQICLRAATCEKISVKRSRIAKLSHLRDPPIDVDIGSYGLESAGARPVYQ